MLNFPNTPAVDQEFVAAGMTYIWNGYGWVGKPPPAPPAIDAFTKTESDARYVDITGDTMTGPLNVNAAVNSNNSYSVKPAAGNVASAFVSAQFDASRNASFGMDSNGYAYYNCTGAFGHQWAISGNSRMSLTNTVLLLNQLTAGYAADFRPAAPSPGTSMAALIGWCPGTAVYGMVGGYVSSVNYSFYGTTGALISGGTWATSDSRLKIVAQNTDTDEALAAVMAVTVRKFAPSSPMAREILYGSDCPPELFGWLADDVEAVLPIASRRVGIPMEDMQMRAALRGMANQPELDSPEGRDLANEDINLRTVNDHYMLATLWAAVQALTARVAALEAAAAPTP